MHPNLKYILYHGTIADIEKIDINQGKGRKDFGKGASDFTKHFY